MHMTMHCQSETEDSHRCSPKESPVPRVTMGVDSLPTTCTRTLCCYRRFTVRWKLAKCITKVQRLVWSMVENLDTCGLDEVLIERDVGSAIGILVNPAWVGRGKRRWQRRVRSICINQIA